MRFKTADCHIFLQMLTFFLILHMITTQVEYKIVANGPIRNKIQELNREVTKDPMLSLSDDSTVFVSLIANKNKENGYAGIALYDMGKINVFQYQILPFSEFILPLDLVISGDSMVVVLLSSLENSTTMQVFWKQFPGYNYLEMTNITGYHIKNVSLLW